MMGACGCVEIQYQARIVEQSGHALLIGIYPGCHYCDAPAGVQFFRIPPSDWEMWDVESVPLLETWDSGMWGIPIVDITHVRNAMKRMITGITHEGEIDDVYAGVLADEAFDDTRDIVRKTLDCWESERGK